MKTCTEVEFKKPKEDTFCLSNRLLALYSATKDGFLTVSEDSLYALYGHALNLEDEVEEAKKSNVQLQGFFDEGIWAGEMACENAEAEKGCECSGCQTHRERDESGEIDQRIQRLTNP